MPRQGGFCSLEFGFQDSHVTCHADQGEATHGHHSLHTGYTPSRNSKTTAAGQITGISMQWSTSFTPEVKVAVIHGAAGIKEVDKDGQQCSSDGTVAMQQ